MLTVRLLDSGLLQGLAALLLAAGALVGPIGDWPGDLTAAEVVALAIAALLLLGLWSRRRAVRIVPFRNLVSGVDKDLFDPVADCFAAQLVLALRRIERLTSDSAMPGAVRPPTRGWSQIELVPATGVEGSQVPTDVGSVTVGPLRLNISPALGLLSRPFAQVITGQIFSTAGEVVVSVHHPSRRRWVASRDVGDEPPLDTIHELARDLAARMVWELQGTGGQDGDWQAFQSLVDGLEAFKRFNRNRSEASLAAAETAFRAAVADAPGFARAYYNLGIVHQEWARLGQDAMPTAVAMWEKAVQLDPGLPEAHVARGRASFEARRFDDASRSYRTAVTLMERQGKPTFSARYDLANALFLDALDHRSEDATLQDVHEQLDRAMAELRRHRRLAWLSGQPRSLLAELDRELAELHSARAEVHEAERGGLARANAARLAARKKSGEAAIHRINHARTLALLNRFDRSAEILRDELRTNAWSHEARHALAMLLDKMKRPGAGAISRAALDHDAVFWWEWFEAATATLAESDEPSPRHVRSAAELLGVAIALAPVLPRSWEELAACLEALGDPSAGACLIIAAEVRRAHQMRQSVDPERFSKRPAATDADRAVYDWAQALFEGDVSRLAEQPDRTETVLTWHAIARGAGGDAWLSLVQRALEGFETSASAKLDGLEDPPVDWELDFGRGCIDRGMPAEAERVFDSVLAHDATSVLPAETEDWFGVALPPEAAQPVVRARALAGRGHARLAMKRFGEARQDCEAALRLDPTNVLARVTLADALAELGRNDEAVEHWEWIARSDPYEAPYARARIGDRRRAESRDEPDEERYRTLLEETAACYREALGGSLPFGVRESRARAALSDCLRELGCELEALAELERAVEAPDTEAWIYADLALAYERAGRLAHAEQALRDGLEKAAQPAERADAGTGLAWFLTKQERNPTEAESIAEGAVADARVGEGQTADDRERLAKCLETLGWARYRLGRYGDAVANLADAVQTSPNAERRVHLALALEARASSGEDGDGDREEARRQWLRIRELEPGSEWAATAARHLVGIVDA